MIRALTIENYRGFRKFTLSDLGRINLIVGTNNAGKTSILEAIQIVAAVGDPLPLWSTLSRRSEDVDVREPRVTSRQLDVRHLFFGHEVGLGSNFGLTARMDSGESSFAALIVDFLEEDELSSESASDELDDESPLFRPTGLRIGWNGASTIEYGFPLSGRGGLIRENLRGVSHSHPDGSVVRFVTAGSLTPDTIVDLFESIVLTDAEQTVIDALRIIEPSIERIATSGTERRRVSMGYRDTRGGLLLRCTGVKDRVPIGSMGDGIWRLLGLALSLVCTDSGILLIDEIDTGLHYSVMEDMWRLVNQTAKRLGTQVFATTHSRDCFEALAAISRDDVTVGSEVTIQRVERGKTKSVVYSEQEIAAAARRHAEVR